MQLTDSAILNNLYVPGITKPESQFEKKYINARSVENRIYRDDEVLKLPDIANTHPHFKEWMIRKQTFRKLVAYLERKKHPLDILEVGCGNGWLSYRLSEIPGCKVTGLDINFTELQQAARVFNHQHNLKFVYCDVRSGILNDLKFDVIIFASSIQYFDSLETILSTMLLQLKPGGEIHITDTHLYKSGEVENARERTNDYYTFLGVPEMSDYYFHHCIDDLQGFNHRILYNPSSIKNKLFNKNNSFEWICIKNP